ncbi:hypothetical protein [Flavobacterium sp. I3-2]|uniref:hypothetical protein n=1 Tax=Flavobacterium sp. I3-2 TaxID=2748319 RepID=UPI0015AD2E17|nr:hypothetical protein [Flavobacterium sp. I3-2]
MKNAIIYIFLISIALVSFGWIMDAEQVQSNFLVQMIEFLAMTIIVFSILSGFIWIMMKIRKASCISNFYKSS